MQFGDVLETSVALGQLSKSYLLKQKIMIKPKDLH